MKSADFSFWPRQFGNIIARTLILSLTRLSSLVSHSLVSRSLALSSLVSHFSLSRLSSLFSRLSSLVSRLSSLVSLLSPSLGHKNTNGPLILKVLEIFFCLRHYMFCPRKKIKSRTFKIRGTLILKNCFPTVNLIVKKCAKFGSLLYCKEELRAVFSHRLGQCRDFLPPPAEMRS